MLDCDLHESFLDEGLFGMSCLLILGLTTGRPTDGDKFVVCFAKAKQQCVTTEDLHCPDGETGRRSG
jgi:hypothetical protein